MPFDAAATIDAILEEEGGYKYTDKATDRGGKTFAGVTIATWNRYARRWGVFEPLTPSQFAARAIAASNDPDHPMRGDVRLIYRDAYIDCFKGLPAGLFHAAVDFGVHSGQGTAAKAVQRVLGVDADGVIGPKTKGKARRVWRAGGAAEALCDLHAARVERSAKFIARKPEQLANLVGWMRRYCRVHAAAIKEAP